MSDNQVYAVNDLNGVVALVPRHYLSHPVLGANLREVRNGKTRSARAQGKAINDSKEKGK